VYPFRTPSLENTSILVAFLRHSDKYYESNPEARPFTRAPREETRPGPRRPRPAAPQPGQPPLPRRGCGRRPAGSDRQGPPRGRLPTRLHRHRPGHRENPPWPGLACSFHTSPRAEDGASHLSCAGARPPVGKERSSVDAAPLLDGSNCTKSRWMCTECALVGAPAAGSGADGTTHPLVSAVDAKIITSMMIRDQPVKSRLLCQLS
jgi:hypothetical protein